ncbi:hypothetical protein KQX54_005055 [Cotesia glomerata]|uniref:Peptidase M12B domain-containing protein n=1 Tax=Cotesia glomerata TaxID=32391 RepID=A0AAV7HVP7_COTGL|nr:hypothetical protein KQX54_005055 [Cotesia glomerata]
MNKCNVLMELEDIEFSDNSISCEIVSRFNTINVEMVINLMKVAALLILVCNAKCHEINNVTNEGVLINSDTRIYHIDYARSNYIKVAHFSGLLKPSSSSIYYNNFRLGSKTLLLKIFVLLNYKLYEAHQNNLMELYNYVIIKWDTVDKYFHTLKWPKVKLLLAGIVLPTHPDIFVQPIEIEDREGYYYPFNSTLEKIKNWLNNNTDQFENFDCDIFFYMSRSLLINDDHSKNHFYTIGGIVDPFRCRFSNPRQPFVIPGGITYDNENFGFVTARTIANGFGIPYDEEAGCESGFIMGISETREFNSWSRCSRRNFKNIFRKKKFSCFKMASYLSRPREGQFDE